MARDYQLLHYPSGDEIAHDLTFEEVKDVAIRSALSTGKAYTIRQTPLIGPGIEIYVTPTIAQDLVRLAEPTLAIRLAS